MAVILCVGSVFAAAEPVFPRHEKGQPGAAIWEYARSRKIPLEGGGQAAIDTSGLRERDCCIVLVTLRDRRKETQWLVDFTVGVMTAKEQEELAAADTSGVTLYTSTGSELTFGQEPVAMNVVVAGPLATDEPRVDRAVKRVVLNETRFVVNGEFLGLGLDRAALTIMRLRDESGKVGFGMRTGTPFPEEETGPNRARLEDRGVTLEDERAMGGAVPALFEVFGIAAKTPGLREILFKVIDVPWWALVKSLGNVAANIDVHGAG